MKRAKAEAIADEPFNGVPPVLGRLCPWLNDPVLRRLQPQGEPHFYGKEDLEMGESTIHTITTSILLFGLAFHFARRPTYRVYGNLNLYFSDDPTEYVSPDVMVVCPPQALPEQLTSYRIGEQGPAPVLVAEVLSFRTWQQGDMGRKPGQYSDLGVEEYVVVDVTGQLRQERLILLRRQEDGSWQDEQDADGGITSRLGFRAIIEDDGHLRVIDLESGKRYARPDEAQARTDELAAAEERIRALEEENTRLRARAKAKKGKGRRRKS